MAMTYGGWFDRSRFGGLLAYVRFMVRRIARLWPLHATMVCAFLLLGLLTSAVPYSRNTIGANLLLVQAWGLSAAMNPPAWSISTEMFAYAAFPLLVGAALKGRTPAALTAAGIAIGYWAVTHGGPPIGPGRRGPLDAYFNYSWLPVLRCVAGFTLGMLAWRLTRKATVLRIARHPSTAPCALAAILALMVTGADDLWVVAILPALVIATHLGRGLFYKALGYGPLHRLGLLSYAVYLLHLFLFDRFRFSPIPTGPELAAYLVVMLAAAAAAHALIEVPGRHLVRHWGERMASRLSPRLTPGTARPLHGPPR